MLFMYWHKILGVQLAYLIRLFNINRETNFQLGLRFNYIYTTEIVSNFSSSKLVQNTNMVQELGDQNGGQYGCNNIGALGMAGDYTCNYSNQLPMISYQSIQQSGTPLLTPRPSISVPTFFATSYPPIQVLHFLMTLHHFGCKVTYINDLMIKVH